MHAQSFNLADFDHNKINEKVLCVLQSNKSTNQIEVDYVNIENPLANLLKDFENLCNNPQSTLEDIVSFIQTETKLNQMNAHYKYCKSLKGSYEGLTVNNEQTIKMIIETQNIMEYYYKQSPEKYNIKEEIIKFKQKLIQDYKLYGKAFAINKAYRICHENKSILTFSHRMNGWSNPVYNLTPNFSVEFKTNFGYGNVSYFFTKLNYKGVEITPLSELIDYEHANFSEITRYTKSHLLDNKYWLEAMIFCKNACNLSRSNEIEFIKKYFIEECEKMVIGLEEILNRKSFSYRTREGKQYKVDKEGHVLTEHRGEKISGALDFIFKILEYRRIATIKAFIDRIEVCNKRIQPILVEELKNIIIKLKDLNNEMDILRPIYSKVVERRRYYSLQKIEIKGKIIDNKQSDLANINDLVDYEFSVSFPEFVEFEKEFNRISTNHRILSEQIQNLNKVYDNITKYNNRILSYFGK